MTRMLLGLFSILSAILWTILFMATIVVSKMLGGTGDGGTPIPRARAWDYFVMTLFWLIPFAAFISGFLNSIAYLKARASIAAFWFLCVVLVLLTAVPFIFFPANAKMLGFVFTPYLAVLLLDCWRSSRSKPKSGQITS